MGKASLRRSRLEVWLVSLLTLAAPASALARGAAAVGAQAGQRPAVETEGCVDADLDGVCVGDDCDDTNASCTLDCVIRASASRLVRRFGTREMCDGMRVMTRSPTSAHASARLPR